MSVVRNAAVTMPDGTRLLRRTVTMFDGVVTVVDRRTGQTDFTGEVLDGDVTGRRFTLLTSAGELAVRVGCRCGG
jgi:hypothetical protein